ncbi:MAG: DUF1361 domain-containing protein [Flavobacteriaceae bacterium]|nr:DUF1361 domain-containing protein [Flavobacteriaceae bacterium]
MQFKKYISHSLLFISNRISRHALLLIGSLYFCLLFLLRVSLDPPYFGGLLVWNLFLAACPYLISLYIRKIGKGHGVKKMLLLGVWLLFLPNAPYILTDFIHFRYKANPIDWFDLYLLMGFSYLGLQYGLQSISLVYKSIQEEYSPRIAVLIQISVPFLCGYGVYIGRFLRFNSWDIWMKPKQLLIDSLLALKQPLCWLFIIGIAFIIFWFYAQKQCTPIRLDKKNL